APAGVGAGADEGPGDAVAGQRKGGVVAGGGADDLHDVQVGLHDGGARRDARDGDPGARGADGGAQADALADDPAAREGLVVGLAEGAVAVGERDGRAEEGEEGRRGHGAIQIGKVRACRRGAAPLQAPYTIVPPARNRPGRLRGAPARSGAAGRDKG
ncbi:MAG: hypothetical protein ACK559_38065, partial [bacterium]